MCHIVCSNIEWREFEILFFVYTFFGYLNSRITMSDEDSNIKLRWKRTAGIHKSLHSADTRHIDNARCLFTHVIRHTTTTIHVPSFLFIPFRCCLPILPFNHTMFDVWGIGTPHNDMSHKSEPNQSHRTMPQNVGGATASAEITSFHWTLIYSFCVRTWRMGRQEMCS